jgi:prophage regulatory protein
MNQTNTASSSQLLRLHEVLRRYPVSRTSWYDGVKIGMYPAPVRLGKRSVAWRESEIEALISELN